LQLYYVGDPAEFIDDLKDSLNLYSQTLLPPLSINDVDIQSGQSLAVLEAEFRGDNVYVAEDFAWRVIVCDPKRVTKHPRGRTLFIHPIKSVEEVCGFVDGSVQSVSIMPLASSLKIRDQLAIAGVDRIVELGVNNVFRIGSSHDGMYPLQRMVRFVSNDLPSSHHPKGITFSIEQTTILKEERFLELVP
jgi:long-chain-fatty-acyl-CoA reductase